MLSISYFESSQVTFSVQCLTALPGANPNCFKKLSSPCEVRDSLFENAEYPQAQGVDTWVLVSGLINLPGLRSNLYAIRQGLFMERYRDYITLSSLDGFSKASQQLKKTNPHLLLIGQLKTIDDVGNLSHRRIA
ncbi:hypothetical protein [Microbulbifer sp. GL-2]|uniref:hypothetical protein n=1 Tax=Microbulbifer sp. GL-2 TaxID=2591606 RepID=UPI001163106B|nr:hypothetical protein [Microbulbifer sp. GL-2]BBM00086.1 hypothetical protein GL2_01600 [Microbulbifer sp. GL-2]